MTTDEEVTITGLTTDEEFPVRDDAMIFADSVYDFGCDRTKDPEGTTVVGDGVGSLKVCSTGGDGFNVKEDSELVERLAAITT